MSDLKFEIEWEDPGGARGEELRATWARLEISVGESIVTRAFDPILNSVRTGLYAPLYPLAEWIVSNWWPLLRECRMPNRAAKASYAKRHNLRFAGEGFAMPWLELRPTRGEFAVEWRQHDLPRQRLSFIQEGSALIASSLVEDSLSLFVNRVIERLDSRGVRGTPLQEDWRSILNQDADEAAFCNAVGAMGLDPFDVPDEVSKAVLAASATLSGELESDFFEAADLEQLDEQLQWVKSGLQLAQSQSLELPGLMRVKAALTKVDGRKSSWSQGYELARELRSALGIADIERIALADLSPGDAVERAMLMPPTRQTGFDALAAVNKLGSPSFVVRQGNELSKRFSFCRALFEFLHSPTPTPSLISAAISEKQKRNRAFAAELLAPERLIRGRMSGDSIDSAEVEDLATRFEVSTYVIAHQIENHQLGEVL